MAGGVLSSETSIQQEGWERACKINMLGGLVWRRKAWRERKEGHDLIGE